MTDNIRRDDMKPASATAAFDRQPAKAQAILRRAAWKGAEQGPIDLLWSVYDDCGGWIMVPTKGGRVVQVAIDPTAGKAVRL